MLSDSKNIVKGGTEELEKETREQCTGTGNGEFLQERISKIRIGK